jgi:hypothetical protein
MSHIALDIENWEKVKFNGELNLSYNQGILHVGLKIDSIKFYFFLKERFGKPNIQYESVAHFFQQKYVSMGNVWCYFFQSDANYIFVTGDDHISIVVLSLNEIPEQLDFDIFSENINKVIEKQDLSKYENSRYDIYVNYSFLLKNLINEYKTNINQKLPVLPKNIYFQREDWESEDPVSKYKFVEYTRDYNQWLKGTLDRATISLQIQILLPIYFESLVDLAFRIKLQQHYFDYSVNYGDDRYKKNIFEYFEGLNLNRKLEEIREKCFSVNDIKIVSFIRKNIDYKIRKKRNKLLHGNSLFLKNLNMKFYSDEDYGIGYPDKHRAERTVTESIYNTLANDEVKDMIRHYENRIKEFIDIFDDNEYFKNLANGIVFGHNPRGGGAISIGFNNLEDLFLPTDI